MASLSNPTNRFFGGNRLKAGQSLAPGQSLVEGNYRFIMQTDGNLVLYDNHKPVWSSGTHGKGSNCILTMQFDGNLVIYSGSKAIWASNTNQEYDNYTLILQKDRNVVIYDTYDNPIWATDTYKSGATNTYVENATILGTTVVADAA